MSFPHQSVLLTEVIEHFADCTLTVFIDGTVGAGGHAAAILESHPEIETFIGFDQDPTALAIAEERLKPWREKVHLIHGNFSEIDEEADGVLLDVGVSSMQLDQPEKGFSFMQEGPLDMRMDPTNDLTAAEIVNTWSEEELGHIIRTYGEEKKWRAAARAIVAGRPFSTTKELADVLKSSIRSKKGIHPATLVFQALRIAVNRELEVLEKVLPKIINLLRPGGRCAVISFHSLEDRIVKNAFRYAASDKESTSGMRGVFIEKEPQVKIITRKPVVASDEEVASNPRARSAKLRVVEKL